MRLDPSQRAFMTVGSQTKLLKLLLGPQGSGGIAEPQVEFLGHHRLGRATARIDAGEPQQLLEPVRLVENFSANTLVSQTRLLAQGGGENDGRLIACHGEDLTDDGIHAPVAVAHRVATGL
jgi:hypothetical protein